MCIRDSPTDALCDARYCHGPTRCPVLTYIIVVSAYVRARRSPVLTSRIEVQNVRDFWKEIDRELVQTTPNDTLLDPAKAGQGVRAERLATRAHGSWFRVHGSRGEG
eukprot:3699912-Rhodomonas_salina.1